MLLNMPFSIKEFLLISYNFFLSCFLDAITFGVRPSLSKEVDFKFEIWALSCICFRIFAFILSMSSALSVLKTSRRDFDYFWATSIIF